MSIDIERLKVDPDYWDEVAPDGAAYYMPETATTHEAWGKDGVRTGLHVGLLIRRPRPSPASLLTDEQAEARMGEPVVIERKSGESPKYPHYFKDVSDVDAIDLYHVAKLYEITDPALFHAFKKIACAGKRGSKGQAQDVQEAIDALKRWQELNK